MFIQTEATANPDVIKFLPGREVLESGSMRFADADSAKRSPLAERLFEVAAVIGVSLEADAIAVTKGKDAEWSQLKPAILGVIMEHFTAGRPVLAEGAGAAPAGEVANADEIAAKIEELLNDRVRSAVEQSGGDIIFRGFENGVANLSSRNLGILAGFQMGVENIIRHYVPEVQEVRFLEYRPTPEENIRDDKPGLNSPEADAIFDVLDQSVNPAVASHGGHIALVDVQGDVAYIRLEGGCQGCGMADVTLKQGVERTIIEKVPTITRVLDTTDHAGGANPYYQPSSK
jgi:Fe-S cluster biogenesis protein NfuA